MKTVTVSTNKQTVRVVLNGHEDGDELTPRMARAARDIAFGIGAYVTVTDGVTAYRVTKRVRLEEVEQCEI